MQTEHMPYAQYDQDLNHLTLLSIAFTLYLQ